MKNMSYKEYVKGPPLDKPKAYCIIISINISLRRKNKHFVKITVS